MTNPTITNTTIPNNLYPVANGTTSSLPFVDEFQPRDPTQYDIQYPIQKKWLNTVTNAFWELKNFTTSQGVLFANWVMIGAGIFTETTYVEDTGDAMPDMGILNVLGADGITTTGSGNTITIALSGGPPINTILGDTGSISGSVVTIYANNAANNSGNTVKFVNLGTVSTLNVSDMNQNTAIGYTAGNNAAMYSNTSIGYAAGSSLNGADSNTLVGAETGPAITSGQENCAFGVHALELATTASSNTSIGVGTLSNLLTGSYNTAIGVGEGNAGSGESYTTSESSNVLIANIGSRGESNTIRIGSQGSGIGSQDTCYIAGIVGNTVSNPQFVTINSSTGQLGVSTSTAITNVNVQTFTTSGTYTPSSGMVYCTIEVVGGGGGSGGVPTASAGQFGFGGAGGGGGYARKTVSASSIGSSQSVTVGAGGSAGLAGSNAGGNGGTSSVGSIVSATGGTGGIAGIASANPSSISSVSGGVGSSGDVNAYGGASTLSMSIFGTLLNSGSGGGSYFGGGASGSSGYSSASPGLNYGGGAVSATLDQNTAQAAGATGAGGLVVITEYISS